MLKSQNTKILGLFLVAALASACQFTTTVTKPVATEPDLVGERIAKASETASKALNDISGIEQQRAPLPPTADYSSAPPSMMQLITVRWSGPADQIVRTLASRAGLSFKAKGKMPAVPLTVSVDVYQQPIIDVLQSIGLQLGQRADLTVDGRSNAIEIRYVSSDR